MPCQSLSVCLQEELSAQVSQVQLPRGVRHQSDSEGDEDQGEDFSIEPSRRKRARSKFKRRATPALSTPGQQDYRSDSVSPEGVHGHRPEGNGILEFTPYAAGQDVTPINLDFHSRSGRRGTGMNMNFGGTHV